MRRLIGTAVLFAALGYSARPAPRQAVMPPDVDAIARYGGEVDRGPPPVLPVVAAESVPLVETCGAPTKRVGACRRRVVGGSKCWQHR